MDTPQTFQLIGENHFSSTHVSQMVDKLLEDVRKAHNEALDGWLKKCVEKWCPLAFEAAKSNPKVAAEILRDKGFHWTQKAAGSDWIATFWENDTPVMCCRLAVRLLNPEYERALDWTMMFHPSIMEPSPAHS